MNLPILKRNYGGTVTVGAGAMVTVYLGAKPSGKVKKLLITGDATNAVYVAVNAQGGTYKNLDYDAALDKKLIGRLQPGYASLPAPGEIADIYNDFGSDSGDFTIHMLKTRGREDDYVMIGQRTAGLADPAPPGYIEEQSADKWKLFVTGCTTVPDTSGYSLNPTQYFQVDATWVEANGVLIPATVIKEIEFSIGVTDQPGIETVVISNPSGSGVAITIESIDH